MLVFLHEKGLILIISQCRQYKVTKIRISNSYLIRQSFKITVVNLALPSLHGILFVSRLGNQVRKIILVATLQDEDTNETLQSEENVDLARKTRKRETVLFTSIVRQVQDYTRYIETYLFIIVFILRPPSSLLGNLRG